MPLPDRTLSSGRKYNYRNDASATRAAMYLHGSGGSGVNFAASVKNAPGGLLQVFPTATTWNDGRNHWVGPGSDSHPDYPGGAIDQDKVYIEDVIADVQSHFGVTVSYVCGFSGGGQMAIYLLNEQVLTNIAISHTVGIRNENWPVQFQPGSKIQYWFAPDDPNPTPSGNHSMIDFWSAAETAYGAGTESSSTKTVCSNTLTTFTYSGSGNLQRYKRSGGHAWVSCSGAGEELEFDGFF